MNILVISNLGAISGKGYDVWFNSLGTWTLLTITENTPTNYDASSYDLIIEADLPNGLASAFYEKAYLIAKHNKKPLIVISAKDTGTSTDHLFIKRGWASKYEPVSGSNNSKTTAEYTVLIPSVPAETVYRTGFLSIQLCLIPSSNVVKKLMVPISPSSAVNTHCLMCYVDEYNSGTGRRVAGLAYSSYTADILSALIPKIVEGSEIEKIYKVYGTVKDSDDSPLQRVVNVHLRGTGEFLASTTSNAAGYFEAILDSQHAQSQLYVVCLDDQDGGKKSLIHDRLQAAEFEV